MAIGESAKKASDYIPYCKDQGILYLMAAAAVGVGAQSATYTMVAGGVVTFAGLGLRNMADGNYQIFGTNHTSDSRAPTVALNTRTSVGFTVASPNVGDVVDLLIVGHLSGVDNT